MNKHIYLSLSIATLATVFALQASPIFADTCGQYGTSSCPPTDLVINKQVRNPITGVFVENLVSGDATYSPDSEVTFLLKIENHSNQNFQTVQVTDTLPDKLVNPKVDENDNDKVKDVTNPDNKTLKFLLKDELKAGETREVKIKAKVVGFGNFAKDKSIFCGKDNGLENFVKVTANDRSDDDTSSLCVQTNVLGTTTLPTAGPEDYLPLLPFLTMGITGMALIFKRK